ncbi:MAG TPA: alpha/beta hydrolase-fold protein [Streptosporangiaceae bacterium]|nr:alpha/beta hydrolase-fold protein [Streptosporangiaceae bacterium]
MGLTSPGLVVVLAIVAAGLLGAVLWWWPRLAGPGLRPVLARVAALGALQLIVLGLIFVIVNNTAEFYSSWSDLAGDQAGGGAIVAGKYHASSRQAPAPSVAPVTVSTSSGIALPGHRRAAAGGRLQTVRIHGALSGLSIPGYVYLPAGYSDRSARLPVVVAVSEHLDSAGDPYSASRLADAAARQIGAGHLEPLILVVLPAQTGPDDQGCLDVPGSTQAATLFAQDLPQAIGTAYRAAAPAMRRWALLGDSAGGYCALQLAMTNSQNYAAAAVPPGDYTGPPGPAENGGSRQIRAQENLAWLLRHQPMQPISVLFTGPGPTEPFASRARPPMHVGQSGLATGPWRLAGVLDWLGGALRQPAAAVRS